MDNKLRRVYTAEDREKQYAEEKHSKDKLTRDSIKKIKTTMIGAIASIEKFFDDYMDDPEFVSLFEAMREEILDKGNKQIRVLETELKQYTVNWNRHEYKFDINRRE